MLSEIESILDKPIDVKSINREEFESRIKGPTATLEDWKTLIDAHAESDARHKKAGKKK